MTASLKRGHNESIGHRNELYRSRLNNTFSDQRREARKRKKQHEKDAEKGEGCADAQEMAEDDKLLSMPAPEKPQPPQEFDKEAILAKVSKQA